LLLIDLTTSRKQSGDSPMSGRGTMKDGYFHINFFKDQFTGNLA